MSGFRRGLVLLVLLAAMMAVRVSTATAQAATAQVATTTVQDTVYSANGTPAGGTVLVSWSAFTTAGGQEVPAGSTAVTIGAGGVLTVALAPNAGSTPMGSYYTAVFHLNDGTTSREYWVVPAAVAGGGPATLAAIKNEVLPASVAMQTVSRAYVDDAIAAASTGFPLASSPYVLTAGDAMSGPLALAADPVNSNQAATKHYVDVNVASASAGLGQKVSLLPTGAQTVAQPVGTNFSIAGTYATTTFGSSGVSRALNFAANGSPTLVSNGVNCSGQGYDLGNNGTSALGWSTCALEDNVFSSSVRGIDQMYAGEFTHNGLGDTAAFYTYLTAFGGKVAASDEGVEHTVLQTHQVGYFSGLVSNGSSGDTRDFYAQSLGVTYLSTNVPVLSTGQLNTISASFHGATPVAGQVVDFLVATNNGGGSFTITNIIPVTLAAVAGVQTFTAGVNFPAVTVTAGQVLGMYVASGVPGAVNSDGGTYVLSGAPSSGTATYSLPGGGDSGLSLAMTLVAASTGATNVATSNFTCNGYCQAMAGQNFADGGILLDMSKGGATATIGAEGSAMGGMYYTLASGTVPVSTAWGNIVSSSCTNNGNGQYQAYTLTTCNVTLGTSPASPGSFVAGQDIFLTGPFEEEAAVTAVGTPVGGVQSITFNTRYAWNGGWNPLVMQGGPGGESLVATSAVNSWPVAYAVLGATSATQVFFSNCVVGTCNGGGNIIRPPNQGLSGGPLTRTGNVVTATATQNNNFRSFAIGSQVTVSGYTPSDLNGTFTVVSNSYDSFNQSVSWTQTGANEASSVSGTVAVADPSITFYPSAFIIGTNNGAQGTAQLATNTVPFAAGDRVVGAPTSEFGNVGLRLAMGQNTPVDGGQASEGIAVNDDGPSPLSYAFFASNNVGSGAAGSMFTANGSYQNDFYFGYRPANNGAVIYVQGGEPVSSNAKPYYLFKDDGSYGSIEFDPNTSTFSISSSLSVVSGIKATGAASSFAAGTTIGGVLPCLQNGTNCPAGTGSGGGGGTGTVSSVGMGAWPSWLTPAVTSATSTPTIAVTASAIPNAALANSSTTVNGQICALGGACTITAPPAAEVKFYQAAVCDGGTAYASGVTRYDNQQPQAGCVVPASSTMGYLAFNAAPVMPQYAEATVSTPPYWTGTGIYLNFYSAAVTGSVTWEVQTACLGAGSVVGAPVFGAAVAVTTTVSATAGGDVVSALLPGAAMPGANGCPASPTGPGLLTYRVYRAASDTAAGSANLLGVTLVTGRSQ